MPKLFGCYFCRPFVSVLDHLGACRSEVLQLEVHLSAFLDLLFDVPEIVARVLFDLSVVDARYERP